MREKFEKLLDAVKKYSDGAKTTPSVREYIFMSNVRSGIFIGVIVSALEIWMLSFAFTELLTVNRTYDLWWIWNHLISYALLLSVSMSILVYSVKYLKAAREGRKRPSKYFGQAILGVFSLIGIFFGLYISYMSADPSGKVFAFITMELFVLGLLVWHPVLLVLILTASFGAYIFLQELKVGEVSYSIKVNAFTTWLVLLVIGFNNHHQRRIEGQKSESLENLNGKLQKDSLIDPRTGLRNMTGFKIDSEALLHDESVDISTLVFVYMNIENFKNYNKKHGFPAGSEFLRKIGGIIGKQFSDDIVARLADDHFVALARRNGIEYKLREIRRKIQDAEDSIQLTLKSGIYAPPSRDIRPNIACDNARYACDSLKKKFNHDFAEYDKKMNEDFSKKQHIVNNLDSAIEKKCIKVFYQPVVLADDGSLCGAEALARWHDPVLGFLPPSEFVPVLEEYHLIHKLDMHVMEQVCSDIKSFRDEGRPVVPISINFSRLDFQLSDPVFELDRCIEKYGIRKGEIHVEITETALVDTDLRLQNAMDAFRSEGYSLWLDDFGSGYSGLNVLKDFNFDMLKIDMKFLQRFSENQKAQPILKSIVSLAKNIGMNTLSEGVETEDAKAFLKSIGCERLQGYLFGKPMPIVEFAEKIDTGFYKISESILKGNAAS